jgi:hypothetical protein
MVRMVEVELIMAERCDISAAAIAARIRPRKPRHQRFDQQMWE